MTLTCIHTHCIDGHSGLKVVHTAQDQIHWFSFFQPSMTENTQLFAGAKKGQRKKTTKNIQYESQPDTIHEMCKIFHRSNVVVMGFK